jgi:hypothetical protein
MNAVEDHVLPVKKKKCRMSTCWRPVYLFVVVAVLGFELRARQGLYQLSHSTNPVFVLSFSEIGSHKLFSRARFIPAN